MAALSLQSFTNLVQNAAAKIQGTASGLADFSEGSWVLAIVEAASSVGLWMQWLILQVLATTRLATSFGPDADSWGADFNFFRLPGVPASGSVTFSRFTDTVSGFIPVGAQVKTSDGTQTFSVQPDPTNAAYSSELNGFTIPAGTSSRAVLVTANTIGTVGNVLAGTITLLASAISGVDTASNALGFTNGVNAESDAAYKARFVNYINSRSAGTPVAIGYAVESVQQGLTYTIQENWNGSVYTPGTFLVTFNDGTGDPSPSLIAAVTAAVQAVRPIGSTAIVQGTSDLTANISLTLVCATTALHTAAVPLVAAAITSYVQGLPEGATLPWSIIARIAYDASPNVQNVTSVMVNGGTADLVPTPGQSVTLGTLAVD